jgi:Raf kinase inhibitor-like YbhB/YbcL family protein
MAQKLNIANLTVSSSAFSDHGCIPDRYTAAGDDVSPPLAWTDAPENTAAFAVVVHDPDAPLVDGFTHWVLYDIPAEVSSLDEGTRKFVHGKNSFGKAGYNGPAPPEGHGIHHYFFWVYALDNELGLEDDLDRRALLERIEDHVIEQARLVGVYER